jgi:2-C-methyl-D-erythritol 2,4-cyclodiphosphate synthase
LPLLIGGQSIESSFGAEGHSDADVLLHAITDALLGALALGDIGSHFSNEDPRWQNADSRTFLEHANHLVREKGYVVENLDCVVDLEKPKLKPHIGSIRQNIAAVLGVSLDRVSVKAKTGEAVDAVGECRAVRAQAVVLLTKAAE